MRFAGGFSGDAYTDNVTVNRKAGSRYSIFTVDNDMMPSFAMMDKDSVSVDSVIAKYDNRVIVRGAVWRPGEYQLSERLNTVKALIDKAEGVKGNAFLSRSILKRQKGGLHVRGIAAGYPCYYKRYERGHSTAWRGRDLHTFDGQSS